MPIWLSIVLLGVVEGITEFLPISSTGHLLLAQHWLPRQSDLFNIVIQAGAVLAVIPLFPERIRQFLLHWREPATQDYLLKILLAFLITAAGGVALTAFGFALPETILPVAIALLVGGMLFILVEHKLKGRPLHHDITWRVAVAVGLAQLVAAVFPGTSRSGSTILIALLLGLTRPAATEFTFLVGIPTMLAASAWRIFKELQEPDGSTEDWAMLALGFVVAAAVSFVVVRWLLRYVQTHTFTIFGWYRIVFALILFLFLATRQ